MGVPMKNLLQDVLIVFSLGVCVLLAIQLHRDGVLRSQLHDSECVALSANETIDALRNDVRRLEGEVARISRFRALLSSSNLLSDEDVDRLIVGLQQHAQMAAELESVKTALTNANLSIAVQSESLRVLLEERNEVADSFNQLAEEYNLLATRWNELQSASTNRPAVVP
jgi:chromosome segregation ATPase